MQHLTRRDFSEAMRVVSAMGAVAVNAPSFASRGIEELPRLVASELTTLSVCDLTRATRTVYSNPEQALSLADVTCFNHFFREHPLVRYHAGSPDGGSRKISDSLPPRAFRRTALYNEYYRRIGIDHAIAVPLFVNRNLLVSFVLNRTRRDFSERDRALLDLVRQPLASLYRHALALERTRSRALLPGQFDSLGVTQRESEVLAWLASGKTDRDIGALLGISPRTVQKHLEHLYVKLGVETRTAAVMRALALSSQREG